MNKARKALINEGLWPAPGGAWCSCGIPIFDKMHFSKEYPMFKHFNHKDEDEDGHFTVSYKKVASAYNWKQLEEVKEQDKVIEGTVVQIVKGGILVDVMGIRGFVPSSHLRAKEIDNIIGQNIENKRVSMALPFTQCFAICASLD